MGASVVIPTTMRRETLTPVVEAALAAVSPLETGEVIVAANGPSEGRRPLEVRSPRLRVLECPVPSVSSARNMGKREAVNDVVLFTDDDCLMSPGWPGHLADRLRNGDIAVATPLETRRDGPVTTFLDYQRIWEPRPIDASTAAWGLGASMGIRRDLVGIDFDEGMTAGDDVKFGCDLRDAGIAIGYVTDAPPLIHLLPEDLETITARFIVYGRTNAIHLLRHDRPEFSIPDATSLYSSLCHNEIATPRRFEEIGEPELRELFATYHLIQLGCLLVGYLDEAGKILGRRVISADPEALAEGWGKIERRLSSLAGQRDWERLPIDFEGWLTPREGKRPALGADVAAHFAQCAGLTREPGPDLDLDAGTELVRRRAERVWRESNAILSDLREGRLAPDEEALNERLRGAGISCREGAQVIETIAQGAIEPATVAG